MLRGIFSVIYGEVNVSVSGGYVLQYVGGTRASICFISVILKSWSGRKLFEPNMYMHTHKNTQIHVYIRLSHIFWESRSRLKFLGSRVTWIKVHT